MTTSDDDGVGSLRSAIADDELVRQQHDHLQHPHHRRRYGTTPLPRRGTLSPVNPYDDIVFPLIIDGTTTGGYIGIPQIQINDAGAGRCRWLRSHRRRQPHPPLAIYSFKGAGIHVESNSNSIHLMISDEPDQTAGLGNGTGLFIDGSANNTVGGLSGLGNDLGQDGDGILVSGNSSTGNTVIGNTIVTAGGRHGRPDSGSGIRVAGSSNTAMNLTIGGADTSFGNTIAFNTGAAVTVQGVNSVNVSHNAIFRNGDDIVEMNDGSIAPVLTQADSNQVKDDRGGRP